MSENKGFRSHENWKMRLAMITKMIRSIVVLTLIVHLLFFLFLVYMYADFELLGYTDDYFFASANSAISSTSKTVFQGKEYLSNELATNLREQLGYEFKKIFVLFMAGFSFYFISVPLGLRYFKKKDEQQTKNIHIRGPKIIEPGELNKQTKKAGEPTGLVMGGVKIPLSCEVKHGLVIGRTGTGKTLAMRYLIEQLRERNLKTIIYDYKGDYLCKFFNAKRDILFNPLDSRSVGWNIFNEIQTRMDINAIVSSLIPPQHGEHMFWNTASQHVLEGLMHHLYQKNRKTNKDLWEVLTLDGGNISAILKKTVGGEMGLKAIDDGKNPQARGIFATLSQYTAVFDYMQNSDGDFSVRKWLEDEQSNFIFITNYSEVQDTLKPVLSLFIDLLGRKFLSMKDDDNRRIFFVVDEFGTLQRLPTIIRLLTLSRSKGGSVWLGIQDTGQIDKIYTKDHRQSIVNATVNNLIFAVEDPETCKFISETIGDYEYSEVEENISMGPGEYRDGISFHRRNQTKRLLLPSEIKNIPERNCYLKLPGFDYARVELEKKKWEDKTESFVMRDDLNMDAIIAAQEKRKELLKEFKKEEKGGKEKKVIEKKEVEKETENIEEVLAHFHEQLKKGKDKSFSELEF